MLEPLSRPDVYNICFNAPPHFVLVFSLEAKLKASKGFLVIYIITVLKMTNLLLLS